MGKKGKSGLNFGKSSGLFTRGGFPTHSDVSQGPLNMNSPAKFDLGGMLEIGKGLMGGSNKPGEGVLKEGSLLDKAEDLVKDKVTKVKDKVSDISSWAKGLKKDPDLNKLASERDRLKKAGEEVPAGLQNRINKALGSKVRHDEKPIEIKAVQPMAEPGSEDLQLPGKQEMPGDVAKKGKSKFWQRMKAGRKELSKGLMALGESSIFQGENAPSFSENLDRLDKAELTEKSLALNNKMKQQKIDAIEAAKKGDDKNPATEKFAVKTTDSKNVDIYGNPITGGRKVQSGNYTEMDLNSMRESGMSEDEINDILTTEGSFNPTTSKYKL